MPLQEVKDGGSLPLTRLQTTVGLLPVTGKWNLEIIQYIMHRAESPAHLYQAEEVLSQTHKPLLQQLYLEAMLSKAH